MNTKPIFFSLLAFAMTLTLASSAFARIYTGQPTNRYNGDKCSVLMKDGTRVEGTTVEVTINGKTQNGCNVPSQAAPSSNTTQTSTSTQKASTKK